MSKRAEYSPGPWTLHEYEDDGVHLADVFDTYQECKTACLNIADARLIAAAPDLLEALHEGRRAIGDHFAPNDCYATGPMTGDAFRDLVQCPACSFIAMYDEAVAKATGADHEQAI